MRLIRISNRPEETPVCDIGNSKILTHSISQRHLEKRVTTFTILYHTRIPRSEGRHIRQPILQMTYLLLLKLSSQSPDLAPFPRQISRT